MKARLLAILASGALVGGVAGAAFASTNYPTHFVQFKLESESGKRTFSGEIDAPTGKCVKGRTVEVIRKRNGNQKVLKKNGTNGNGKFSISLSSGDVKNGGYYAKVKVKKYDSGKKVCEAAQSGTIKIS